MAHAPNRVAFRPVGLKGSRERPARLTVILNYLEKVCVLCEVCEVAVRSLLAKVSSLFLYCFGFLHPTTQHPSVHRRYVSTKIDRRSGLPYCGEGKICPQ